MTNSDSRKFLVPLTLFLAFGCGGGVERVGGFTQGLESEEASALVAGAGGAPLGAEPSPEHVSGNADQRVDATGGGAGHEVAGHTGGSSTGGASPSEEVTFCSNIPACEGRSRDCETTVLSECGERPMGWFNCGEGVNALRGYFFGGAREMCDGSGGEFNCINAALLAQEFCADSIIGEEATGSGGSAAEIEECTDVWCPDTDRDGYSDPAGCVVSCERPGFLYTIGAEVDCYDGNLSARPIHPDATTSGFFAEDRGDGSFDYNCDDEETHEYGIGSCNVLDVPNAEGWIGKIPNCGQEGNLVLFDIEGHCGFTSEPSVVSVARCQ